MEEEICKQEGITEVEDCQGLSLAEMIVKRNDFVECFNSRQCAGCFI